MKQLCILLAVSLAAACGPSGDDDDDAPRTLTSGLFVVEAASISHNDCGIDVIASDLDDTYVDLWVGSESVELDGSPFFGTIVELDRYSVELQGSAQQSFNLSEQGLTCVARWEIEAEGRHVASEVVRLSEHVRLEAEGADCDVLIEAEITLPCTLDYSYTLTEGEEIGPPPPQL